MVPDEGEVEYIWWLLPAMVTEDTVVLWLQSVRSQACLANFLRAAAKLLDWSEARLLEDVEERVAVETTELEVTFW